MFRKEDKYINHARKYIQEYSNPNIIYYIELERRRTKLLLQRFMLHELSDGSYVVSRATYNCRGWQNSVEHDPNFFVTKHKHLALESIGTEVTSLEQEEYEVTDEFSGELCKNLKDIRDFASPLFQTSTQFFNDNAQQPDDFLFQDLPGGLQVVVLIDEQGKIKISDLEMSTGFILEKYTFSGRAGLFLNELAQRDGFRGMLAEAIYDGDDLFITDAHYIHNSDLSDMTFSERYRVLCQHLPLSDNNATSGLIEARELPPQLWGATSRYGFIKGLMARKKIDLGSFCSFGEKHTPSVIIGEKSPDYCDCVKAGNKIATLRDHASKRSHTMKYPVEKTKMMLKSVRVIGGINETELSLIF